MKRFTYIYGTSILLVWGFITWIVYLTISSLSGFIMACIAMPYLIYNLYLTQKYSDKSELDKE